MMRNILILTAVAVLVNNTVSIAKNTEAALFASYHDGAGETGKKHAFA